MTDEDRIYESAETMDEAFSAVKTKAAEKWGPENFMVTVNPSPSKNLTTGQVLLYTAVAKRITGAGVDDTAS